MRIVQIIPDFSMGGAEIMCEQLSRELQRTGHEVTAVSLYDTRTPITERLEADGIRVEYLGKQPGLDLSIIRKLRRLLCELSPDAVHTHLHALKYVLFASRGHAWRMVHTVHNMAEKEFGRADRFLARRAYQRGRVTPVALSPEILRTVVATYGLPEDAVGVLYNGIDLSRCIQKTDYTAHTPFRILHIGRFNEQKNHLGMLEAFRLFHEEHRDSELCLIGDGDGRARLEAYIREHNLEDAVHLLGLQSNVYPFLAEADLFTLPSLYEGVPMTLIEAMGSALPIVATAVGGVPDMLRDGEDARLVPVETEAITRAFAEVYASAERRETFGRGALARSEAFSVQTMARGYLALYGQTPTHL